MIKPVVSGGGAGSGEGMAVVSSGGGLGRRTHSFQPMREVRACTLPTRIHTRSRAIALMCWEPKKMCASSMLKPLARIEERRGIGSISQSRTIFNSI